MKKSIKYLASAVIIGLASGAMQSCSDWTEPESVDLNYGTIDKAPNYQVYLANLKAYRASDHKKIYAWFESPADGPVSQAHTLASLPDSIDVVVFENPAVISDQIKKEMAQVNADKGMEFMYTVDFDALKATHKNLGEELAAKREALTNAYLANENKDDEAVTAEYEEQLAALATPDLTEYLLENCTELLSYAKTNGFHGVMFAFDGKATQHLTTAEKKDYLQQMNAFIGVASDWHKRNPEMKFDYLGAPQNIAGTDLINDFGMLFIRDGLNATNGSVYSQYLAQALTDGVPADRIGMMTTFTSLDPADGNMGLNSDGSYALTGCAKWAAHNNVAAVGMKKVQNDYYNPSFIYPVVRAAIQTINPSIK